MEQPVRIYLVCHVSTVESWRTALDAPLSESGRRQADKVAPATLWQTDVHVEPRITKILAPSSDPKIRGEWLMQTSAAKWSAREPKFKECRDNVLSALSKVIEETVMVTHCMVVNAVVGAATGDDQVICFHPDDTDTTVIDKIGGRFNVIDYSLEEISDAALVT